jgi:hypothetical protein
MDPQACYERWRSAVQIGDVDEAREARADLCEWFGRGGAKPQWTERERAAFFAWDPRRPLALVKAVLS